MASSTDLSRTNPVPANPVAAEPIAANPIAAKPVSTAQGMTDMAGVSAMALPLEIPFYQLLGSYRSRRITWLTLMLGGQISLVGLLVFLDQNLLFYIAFLPFFWISIHKLATILAFSGTWHVFRQDENGALILEQQYRFRGRVWRRKKIDLSPYTWLRVCEPGDADVCLELGNRQYQTYTLGSIVDTGTPTMSTEEREQARAELVALGAQVAQLTGVEDRGWRSIC